MTAAGAKSWGGWKALTAIRWARFLSLRFWGAALVAVAAGQAIIAPAHAPSAVSPRIETAADPDRPDPERYVGFGLALREAYTAFVGTESEALGADFDSSHFTRNLKLLAARNWPELVHPAALGLGGPTGVAVDEGRLRLTRLFSLGAREQAPRLAAAAQAGLECWATRAAARRDEASIADCKTRFFDAVLALEDTLLPLRVPDQFNRRLAREYLAYAHYKAAVERDQIDARHFADKGLRAAEAQPLEPEELGRWFGLNRTEARDLAFWRIRLELAIEAHRSGPLAAVAATALARFDCWVDRTAGYAAAEFTAKCRGDFIDAMRRIDAPAGPDTESIPIRFAYDRLVLDGAERAKVARVAKDTLERNAVVAVAALSSLRGHWDVESRHAWRRAETVAAMLAAHGVPAERIRLLQRAASDSENESGLRRVEIVLQAPPQE